MKSIHKFSFATLLATAHLFVAASASFAEGASEATFCIEGERYYPSGQIVALGDRYFFMCRGSWAFPPLVNVPYVKFDRHQEFLDNAIRDLFPDLRYGGFIDDMAFSRSGRPYPTINADVGEVELGGLAYTVLVADYNADRVEGPIELGNLPNNFLLHFLGDATDQTPEHYLSCNQDPTTSPPPDQYSCRLLVRYKPTEHLYYTVFLSYAEEFPFARAPFDFQQLGSQTRGMEFVAEQMDVTDRLNEFEGVPIARAEE